MHYILTIQYFKEFSSGNKRVTFVFMDKLRVVLLSVFFAFLFLLSIQSFAQNSEYAWQKINPHFDSLFALIDKNYVENKSISADLVEELHRFAVQNESDLIISRYLYLKSILLTIHGNHEESLDTLKKAILILDTAAYPFDHARYMYLLAYVNRDKGNYSVAFDQFYQSLKKFELLDDMNYVARVSNQLGLLLLSIDEYGLALEYLQRSKNIYRQLGMKKKVIDMTLNISSVIADSGKKQEAIRQLKSVVPLMQQYQDTSGWIKALNNIGLNYSAENDYQQAGKFLNQAMDLATIFKNEELITMVNINLGSLHFLNTDYLKAMDCFKQVRYYAKSQNNIRFHILAYLGLANTFGILNEWDSAFINIMEYIALRDSVDGIDKASKIQKIQVKESIIDLNNKLEIEKQNNEIKQKRLIIITLSGSLVLLVFISVIIFIQQQKRNLKQKEHLQEITNSQLIERMAKDKVIQQLKEENYQHEIDSKNRELSTSALMLSKKSEVLGKIMELSGSFYQNSEISQGFYTSLNSTLLK